MELNFCDTKDDKENSLPEQQCYSMLAPEQGFARGIDNKAECFNGNESICHKYETLRPSLDRTEFETSTEAKNINEEFSGTIDSHIVNEQNLMSHFEGPRIFSKVLLKNDVIEYKTEHGNGSQKKKIEVIPSICTPKKMNMNIPAPLILDMKFAGKNKSRHTIDGIISHGSSLRSQPLPHYSLSTPQIKNTNQRPSTAPFQRYRHYDNNEERRLVTSKQSNMVGFDLLSSFITYQDQAHPSFHDQQLTEQSVIPFKSNVSLPIPKEETLRKSKRQTAVSNQEKQRNNGKKKFAGLEEHNRAMKGIHLTENCQEGEPMSQRPSTAPDITNRHDLEHKKHERVQSKGEQKIAQNRQFAERRSVQNLLQSKTNNVHVIDDIIPICGIENGKLHSPKTPESQTAVNLQQDEHNVHSDIGLQTIPLSLDANSESSIQYGNDNKIIPRKAYTMLCTFLKTSVMISCILSIVARSLTLFGGNKPLFRYILTTPAVWAVRLYIAVFHVSLAMVEMNTGIPGIMPRGTLRNFVQRGFIQSFIGLVDMCLSSSKTLEEHASDGLASIGIERWVHISFAVLKVTPRTLIACAILYFILGSFGFEGPPAKKKFCDR